MSLTDYFNEGNFKPLYDMVRNYTRDANTRADRTVQTWGFLKKDLSSQATLPVTFTGAVTAF